MNIFHFDDVTWKKVLEMFNRKEEEAHEDVQIVREWMKTQTHLPELMQDVQIMNMLIENKFSIEKTKQKIDYYYTVRSLIPEFYAEGNPKSLKEVLETVYCCVHPNLIDGLYRAIFFHIKEKNRFDASTGVLFLNIAEIRLFEDCMVGEVFFIDMENITLSDARKITPILVAKVFKGYKAFSLRMKAMHFLNSPPYISIILGLLKTILKPKLFQRVYVHKDAQILKETFSEEDLPEDYGGRGPSLQHLTNLMKEKMVQYQERFDKLAILRVDEDLRPTKLSNDEVLGFYGNFKQLNID